MITTVIAAHMASRRLPGKTLMKINGKTCLEHVVEAAAYLQPVVATYNNPLNYPIMDLCEAKGIPHFVYQGEAYDVLGRFYHAVQCHHPKAHWVLRLTPDCPMLTSDLVMKFFYQCHLRENVICTNRPCDNDGYDLEMFPVKALERANKFATDVHEREHCTMWMYRHLNVDRFSILDNEEGMPEPAEKLSIDTLEEFHKVKALMEMNHVVQVDETRTPDLCA